MSGLNDPLEVILLVVLAALVLLILFYRAFIPVADEPRDPRKVRARRVMLLIQAVLLITALTLFYLALDRPAWFVDTGWGSGPADKPSTGWECLEMGFYYWPSNGLLLLSPVVALALAGARRPIAFIVAAVLYVISGVWVGLTALQVDKIGQLPGYVLWLCSHALVTLAILLPTWRDGPRPPRRAYRRRGFPVVMDGPKAAD